MDDAFFDQLPGLPGGWVAVDLSDIGTDGMTTAEVAALGNIDVSEAPSFNVAMALHTTSGAATPQVDAIEVGYTEDARYDMLSIGKYGSTAEIGVQRVNPTTTKMKNQTGDNLTVLLSVVVPE